MDAKNILSSIEVQFNVCTSENRLKNIFRVLSLGEDWSNNINKGTFEGGNVHINLVAEFLPFVG